MIGLAERGWLPDALVRFGIRRLIARRLADESARANAATPGGARIVPAMVAGPVAVATDDANEQHYEVPAAFFRQVLGRRMKYSGCHWGDGVPTLDEAEERALAITCEHAGLADGMEILELGCGWGSLTLWMAEHFPDARILAVSNSASQRLHIEAECARRGFQRVEVVTADVADFDTDRRFDRVVSVEMFEHMRNWRELLSRIAAWLAPGGRLFVHIFCHRRHPYFFEVDGAADWMAREFFTGGLMPSADLIHQFDDHLVVEDEWRWGGDHYRKTAEAWLENLDRHRPWALDALTEAYGPRRARRALERWRIFFMACAELFGYAGGSEWWIAHYLLAPVARKRDGS